MEPPHRRREVGLGDQPGFEAWTEEIMSVLSARRSAADSKPDHGEPTIAGPVAEEGAKRGESIRRCLRGVRRRLA